MRPERPRGEFAFDLHVHTSEHSSCSRMSAAELIQRAVELGLAGIVVTDHHYQWPLEELRAIADAEGADGLVVLSAYELTTRDPTTHRHAGDLLIYGAPEGQVMPIWTPWSEACARAREHNALIIAAHPFREGAGVGDRLDEMDIDGLEVYNQNHTQLDVSRARAAVFRTGLRGLAASDAHRVSQVGQFVTVFQHPVQTMDELIREIRAGRYEIRSNRPDIR